MAKDIKDHEDRRSKQISDMQALKALLQRRGDAMPCSEAATILGWPLGRPETLRNLFTMYFVTWSEPGKTRKNMVDLHPHLKSRRTI